MWEREKLLKLNKEDLIKIIEEQGAKIEELNGAMQIIVKYNILLEDKLPKNPLSGEQMYFRQEWCYVDKLVYILKLAQRPLKSPEILQSLLKHDQNANHWSNKVKSLSVYLNKAIKYNKLIFNKVIGKRGYYYSLPEWEIK